MYILFKFVILFISIDYFNGKTRLVNTQLRPSRKVVDLSSNIIVYIYDMSHI